MTMNLLRSVLYMPAANARALEKAKTIPCDAIIFDLEDAVAPDAKAEARDRAVAAATSGEYGRRLLAIRCNGLATEWGSDDLAAAAAGPAAVVIPKVDSLATLDDVASRLDAAGAPSPPIRVWPCS
jgi:citrate lyase subunit beta/citryl-CoA lyase